MDESWTTRVKCQGPGCGREQAVDRPGVVRPGWLILAMQSTPLTGKPPEMKYLPFCSMTCLYNWAAARLPSKAKEKQ